ncbi:putative lipoprotein [Podospora appendiculata]|uniref:Lipoprotein n=1 Tax=Podospora appendiculata TaxID=314037 RepID=A0AAE0XCG5_9PEZI|nr:putative lipoprotein [Podospora appendiculata]
MRSFLTKALALQALLLPHVVIGASPDQGPLTAILDGEPSHESIWPHLPRYYTLPSLQEQAAIQDAWTEERRARIPKILQNYGVDAWLISQREYAEDTVFWSIKSARQFAARRRTTFLFLANASHGTPDSYRWIDNTPKLWQDLKGVLAQQDLKSIAVNTHADIAFSSGLRLGEYEALVAGIGKKWAARLVSKPIIGVDYVASMPESRAIWYRRLQSTAWAMISEAFSERVIVPGETTTTDVEWWMREKIQQMNYTTWFHPAVTIITGRDFIPANLSSMTTETSPSLDISKDDKNVINFGDLLHVDFGVTALGLNTDTQHLAYVLYPGQTEDDIPRGFIEGLKKGNRLQDIVKSNMKIGRTGNEILKASLDQMRSEGIEGTVYSHPIGDWGHSAGPVIGMTNLQDGVPVLGDLPLLPNMYYSVELLVEHFVPERNATLQFPLEEDIRHVPGSSEGDDDSVWLWAYARQERFHVVRTPLAAAERKNGLGGGYL